MDSMCQNLRYRDLRAYLRYRRTISALPSLVVTTGSALVALDQEPACSGDTFYCFFGVFAAAGCVEVSL